MALGMVDNTSQMIVSFLSCKALVFCCISDQQQLILKKNKLKEKKPKTTYSLIHGICLCLSLKWEGEIDSISLHEGGTISFSVCCQSRIYRNSYVQQHIQETIFFCSSMFRIFLNGQIWIKSNTIDFKKNRNNPLLSSANLALYCHQEGKMQPWESSESCTEVA